MLLLWNSSGLDSRADNFSTPKILYRQLRARLVSLFKRQRILEHENFPVCGIADIDLVAMIGGYTWGAHALGNVVQPGLIVRMTKGSLAGLLLELHW
jgi:hypothetical protein